ncbi:hypothetical protein [Mesorhizobium sp. Cs1299R1N3]|uniref:hypothetical protein n=1 Tax=Mesorhizobium sp. Cs1299R1N3 TaxID=3015173 RepID=UPI00301DDFCC
MSPTVTEMQTIARPDPVFDALKLAEATIANTLQCRGYRPGECTDGWSPEVRREVATLATVRAVITKAEAAS